MTTLFEDDCYGSVLTVNPFTDALPDWLAIEVTSSDDVPEHLRSKGYNALSPERIQALRDVLTAWLDEHPVKPDPFANGAEIECSIGGTTFLVSRIDGSDQP